MVLRCAIDIKVPRNAESARPAVAGSLGENGDAGARALIRRAKCAPERRVLFIVVVVTRRPVCGLGRD